LVLFSCKTKNILYVDYVLVEKTDGSKDTLTHKYWNKFTWDEYKMEWFIKYYNINIDEVEDIKLLYVTKQRFSNKELGK
jgi:hypothetical protein